MSSISIKNKKIHKVESGDIFVHRGYPLGNPFVCEPFGQYTRQESIQLFDTWLSSKVFDHDPEILDALREIKIKQLKGESFGLICCCFPLNCHAQIIKDWIESHKFIMNWFSNMARLDRPIKYQGINYYSVENFYQAMKIDKSNMALRERFAKLTPAQAKNEAKNLPKRQEFFDKRLEIIEYGLRQKFLQPKWNKYIKEYKGDIVEYNNWGDEFWGVNIFNNCGENNLGKILMKIKAEL
jgi:predicted NAD-dependent protein-ADP-ribosyltransferase YbiA (DUF1768 family)